MKTYTSVIFWMRTIACLSIVLIHSITTTFSKMDFVGHSTLIRIIQLLLMFSTPLFVFISEFLLAKNYHVKTKPGFFKNKLIYLGIPYLFINIGISFFYFKPKHFSDFLHYLSETMFHGAAVTYFIVIIFQFYILHYLFSKYLIKWKPIPVIIGATIFATLYWAFRQFVPQSDNPVLGLFWEREGWMLFLGWISYFLLGFYTGVYYETFMKKIKNYTWAILLGAVLSIVIMVGNYLIGISTWVESKRFDIPFYVTMVILVFFLFSSYFKYVPKFILFISNYSFCIYLIHYFFVHNLGLLRQDSAVLNITFNFIITLAVSICLAYIFNLFKFGKYIVGGIGNVQYDHVYESYKHGKMD
ncbi:acyltransferase family protein [Staphylococcus gallinarum]|jgi:membrane-bound acyltransferase YfiQ involved in biofilm formation|uniref:acyltransferase family protein n=1 Tax=Staphylococcus gallinarum TaxID=1293 RepID=UPI000D1E9273|nr:acyltransferase family protein [Staphylococcus gallinarum]MCD8821938.1 acyltransferase family protein [Staphylococcus gallinarum]MCD8870983.1 acyltransferase family protein [Staphylococcus gallinarum]MCQ9288539.1 acyltransferase family protein [Staphylococcus gallinarum]MCW0985760.1 acyltransferase family protein [Staphylococcus gallinarum]MEB6242977.1 acyltransferase family protein [Staphylococcus gallinarum]